jgi:hypothetical protein
MTRAANNVAMDTVSRTAATPASTTKFSHLHIVFRDWQAVGSSPASVFSALFDREDIGESATRDRIREEVLANFASVRVWLFDAPTESAKALKSKLTIEMTTASFRRQLREFRAALAIQLKEPTVLAGQLLTCRNLGPVMNEFGKSLNSGHVVLPHSAFVNMITLELNRIKQRYERDATESSREWIAKCCQADESGYFPAEAEVRSKFSSLLCELVNAFIEEARRTAGEDFSAGIELLEEVQSDSVKSLRRHCEQLTAHLLSTYRVEFSSWLRVRRQQAEAQISQQCRMLLDSDEVYSSKRLEQLLDDIDMKAKIFLGKSRYEASEEMSDALTHLERYAYTQRTAVINENLSRLTRIMPGLIRSACQKLLQSIPITIAKLCAAHPTGVAASEVEMELNTQYNQSLKAVLDKATTYELSLPEVEAEFETACVDMNKVLKRAYNDAAEEAIQRSVNKVCKNAIDGVRTQYVQQLEKGKEWDATDAATKKFEASVSAATEAAINQANELTQRWSIPSGHPSVRELVMAKLHEDFANIMANRQLSLERQRKEKALEEERAERDRLLREQARAEEERRDIERRKQLDQVRLAELERERQAQLERNRLAQLESERVAKAEHERILTLEKERRAQLEKESEQLRRAEQDRLERDRLSVERSAMENTAESKRRLESVAFNSETPAKRTKSSSSASEQLANAEKWFQSNLKTDSTPSAAVSGSAESATKSRNVDVVAAAVEAQRKAEEERRQQAAKDAANWDKKKRGKK